MKERESKFGIINLFEQKTYNLILHNNTVISIPELQWLIDFFFFSCARQQKCLVVRIRRPHIHMLCYTKSTTKTEHSLAK